MTAAYKRRFIAAQFHLLGHLRGCPCLLHGPIGGEILLLAEAVNLPLEV